MSTLGEHLDPSTLACMPNNFYRVQPQVLRKVLSAIDTAVDQTVELLGDVRALEPQFTRQLAASLEDARDRAGGARYHIEHQGELPVRNAAGLVIAYRRLDLRILFTRQVGRRGDYLCIECKYLDATDRKTDADYVDEGVDRIRSGAYAAGHRLAVMIGLERSGPILRTMRNVHLRLCSRYSKDEGLVAPTRWSQPNIRESTHPQGGGGHQITLVHCFWPVTSQAGWRA